jgi:hypothetical protein
MPGAPLAGSAALPVRCSATIDRVLTQKPILSAPNHNLLVFQADRAHVWWEQIFRSNLNLYACQATWVWSAQH